MCAIWISDDVFEQIYQMQWLSLPVYDASTCQFQCGIISGYRKRFPYVELYSEMWGKIAAATKPFEESQVPLILWGIGASTAQLLNGNFDRCNVIQLIDSNPARQGISFQVKGRMLPVEDPSSVKNREAIIFILSTAYKVSIERSIRGHGYQNEIVSL